MLIEYLTHFKYIDRDSLVLYPTDFSYKVFVALYRAISERTSADKYAFFNWPAYTASLKTLRDRAEQKIRDDLFDKDFCFVFDLMLYDKPVIDMFCRVLNEAYIQKMKLFVATRIDVKDMQSYLPLEIFQLYESKMLNLAVKQ